MSEENKQHLIFGIFSDWIEKGFFLGLSMEYLLTEDGKEQLPIVLMPIEDNKESAWKRGYG